MRSLFNLGISEYQGVIACDYSNSRSTTGLLGSASVAGVNRLNQPNVLSKGRAPGQGDFLLKRDYKKPEKAEPDWIPLSFEEWDNKIQQNFEHYFYIPTEEELKQIAASSFASGHVAGASMRTASSVRLPQLVSPTKNVSSPPVYYEMNSSDVFRRGIYKDVLGCRMRSWDYQLRPNQCVAMVVAPELFAEGDEDEEENDARVGEPPREPAPIKRQQSLRVIGGDKAAPVPVEENGKITKKLRSSAHVHLALDMITEILKTKNSLGIATLDPADWQFRGTYEQFDTKDYNTSSGFSYHQGLLFAVVIIDVNFFFFVML
jgi:hypothetical protein